MDQRLAMFYILGQKVGKRLYSYIGGIGMISKTSFGMTSEGEEAFLYTLTSEKGMTIKVTNYGATLCSVYIQGKDSIVRDVVLGYDDVTGYDKKSGTYFGATIGRNANRIANASFMMDGVMYHLEKNNREHNLHSGSDGFSYRLWEEKNLTANSVTFKLHSSDGNQGYPNAVDVELTYILNDNKICIVHSAKSEEKVFLNMTNHSYFNLDGHDSGNILEHQMLINSDAYLESDKDLIPTGRILNVENTPMDFRQFRKIGSRIHDDYGALIFGNGYDHCWVLKNNKDFEKVAILHSDKSGITMEVFTDMPGIQVYTGNFIENEEGKQGVIYLKNQGVCFETQYFPNAINESAFEIGIVEKNKRFCSATVFKFI